MTDESIEGWDPALRREAGALLAARLQEDAERAHAIAGSLAPDGPGPGVRFARYEGILAYPRAEIAYQTAFPSLDAFLDVLGAGDPGALELGLEILARLDPDAVLPVVPRLLARGPWTRLGKALGSALGRASSEESFALLVDHPAVPYLRDGLAAHAFSGGVARAWATYEAAGDLARPDLDARLRVQVLPVLSYLLRHDAARAYPELVRLTGASHEVAVYASHALLGMGTPESLAVLTDALARTPPGERLAFPARLGVKVLLQRDPTSVIDALGGVDALLAPERRPRLAALLDWLRVDTFSRGEKHGWLAADPRFAELCERLRRDADRDVARLATDLLRTLPARPKPAAKARSKAPAAIDAALVAEMEAHRAELERLVEHLATTGYRFVDRRGALTKPSAAGKRAIARLEKRFGPLPAALAAWWQVVGAVDLRGQDPRWPHDACLALPGVRERGVVWQTDPLVIAAPEAVIAEALDAHEDAPLPLWIAPDATGKAGYSGGVRTIWLPSELADPRIEGGRAGETLREHVARALRWAGMPGFEGIEDRPTAWLEEAREEIGAAGS